MKNQPESLPKDLMTFLSGSPSRGGHYEQQLKVYDGRLKSITDALSVQEITDFLQDIQLQPSDEQKLEGIDKITAALSGDYCRELDEIDSRQAFDLSVERDLQGFTFARIPLAEVAQALWAKEVIIEAFNHPLRIKVRELYEKYNRERGPVSKLPPMNISQALADNLERGDLRAFDEFALEAVVGPKISRRLALAIGVYTAVGPKQVAIPFGSETMHTVIGNPIALADMVRCHGLASAPRNGKLADPHVQAQLLTDTIRVLEETPFLSSREDREKILQMWISNLGILVEPDPYQACKRLDVVLSRLPINVGHARVYMVEGADEMINTARIVKKYFPEIQVHVGQVIHEKHALQAEEVGAASIGVGIAGGSRCSTSIRTGIAGQNFNFLYKLRKLGISIALFAESGVNHASIPVGLAAGFRRINFTAGALGFLSANGHWYAFQTPRGEYVHPYDGEAGDESKRSEGRLYKWEFPIMLEGVDGWHSYDPKFPTIPHRLWSLTEIVALTNVFQKKLFHEDLLYGENVVFRSLSNSMINKAPPYDHY